MGIVLFGRALTPKQAKVYNFFKENRGISTYEAAKYLHESSTYVGVILGYIEEKGYVKIARDRMNKRNFKVMTFYDKPQPPKRPYIYKPPALLADKREQDTPGDTVR